jgi:hypothetical protein
MPAYARADIIDESSVGMYHCINRCVRRSYLCGEDHFTGKNYDHRKEWLERRLKVLVGIFAIEAFSFAIMDNHIHLVLINRPDYVRSWTDEEVVDRWWGLYPRKAFAKMPEVLRQEWLNNIEFITKIRRRLSSISWLMRCLCEPLARIANREDKVSGRFWEGRFKSIKVLDQEAAVETGIYVDLNPIKAGISDSIENSAHTSIAERIRAITFNVPLSIVKPMREVLQLFAEEAPFLLEDECDYITVVRMRAEELVADKIKMEKYKAYFSAFPTAIGSASSLRKEAQKRGKKWLRGLRKAS